MTVRDWAGATASAQINLCNSDPSVWLELVAAGAPKYKSNVGCPVSVDNGNMFTYPQRDISIPGRGLPLEFARMYNSRSTDQLHMGFGWNHTYDRFLAVLVDGAVKIIQPDGSWVFFQKAADGSYTPLYGEKTTLEKLAGGTYVHREKDGIAYRFEPTEGHLLSITDPNGNSLQLSYSDGLLSSVTDPAGRTLTFTYNNHLQVETVTDPSGRVFRYSYDANDNLTLVTYPDGTTRTYQYADPRDVHNLTAILDANGNEVESHLYDEQDRAITSCKAGCRESVTLSFDELGKTTVTDSLGNQRIYRYDLKTGATLSIEESDGTKTEYAWDEQLNKILSKDRRGNTSTYTYDQHGNVLAETDPAGVTTAYTYETTYNRPTSKTEPATQVLPPSMTQFLYDSRGNLTQVIDPVGGTTTLSYDSLGQLTQIDGPRTDVPDVTGFTYDAYGNLATVTNSLGHVTQFVYDLLGNLLSVTDPNGNVTRYTYDLRDRPTQIAQPNSGTIQNTYDPAGNLMVLTNPKGNQVQMAYNPVNQLLELKDPLGNTITYTYDIEGRRTGRALTDPSGITTTQTAYGYDVWHRLTAVTEADGSTTAYTYDAEGNRTSQTDPKGNITQYAYDAKNRLTRLTDPAGGVTQYAYDTRGNLTQVTDPKGNTTFYTYDARNRLIQIESPDTGRTTYEYDPAGNLVRKTDGRGVVTTYTYDALNRLTGVSFPDPAETIAYQYDQGGNGIGRLTGMSDPAGSTAYSYDPMRQLSTESFTSAGVTLSTQFAYDLNGNLTQLTTPSGRLVEYAYDPADRLSEVAAWVGGNQQLLATGFSYLPFGPLKTMTQGNNILTTGEYDNRYRLVNSGVGTNTVSTSYAYDPVGNILTIVNNLNPEKTRRFGYDPLDRLLYGEGIWGTLDYQYDSTGNRITETRNGTLTDYSYQANRLTSTTGAQTQSFAYDGAGNTTQKIRGSLSTDYVYNQNGRMIQALGNGTVVGDYRYDGLGRRRIKTAGGKTTLFHYDPTGHLLTETDGQGKLVADYLWAQDRLLALVTPQKVTTLTAQVACEPRTLNLRSEGKWIECTIELPPPNRPRDIDLRSVKLNGTVPAALRHGEMEDENHNGIPELEVKFPRQQVEAILSVGDAVSLTLTGTVTGISFTGTTAIRVISQGKKGKEKDKEHRDKDKKERKDKERGEKDEKEKKDKKSKEAERDDDRKKPKGWRSALESPEETRLAGLPDLSALPQLASLSLLELGPILAQATVSQVAPSEVLLYVHTDHLGTPVMMTDDQGQTVWEADMEPFGETTITAQPGVTLNLRFPGQYFDSETGLHYNYFRDYDPNSGRYFQADPVGLDAGINLFVYVGDDPLGVVDPLGLIWVKVGYRYSKTKNVLRWWLNRWTRVIGEGMDPTLPGSAPEEYVGLTRFVIQEWRPDPNNPCRDKEYPLGTRRKIKQEYTRYINPGPGEALLDDPEADFYYQWSPWVEPPTYKDYPNAAFENLYFWRQGGNMRYWRRDR